MIEKIKKLHETYVAVTGTYLPYNMEFEQYWYNFAKAGATPDDLRLLLKDRIRSKAPDYCLTIQFICDYGRIGDSLNRIALIKARMRRGCYVPGKADVLRATGRADAPEPIMAKPVADVLRKVLDSV